MAQYKIGSVNVTNGSATVTGIDTLWSAEVSSGDIFTIVGDNAWYEVGSVGGNTSITLTSSYVGTTASGAQYAISRDFTTNKSIPYPQKGDIETASLLKRAMNIIDTELLFTAGGSPTQIQYNLGGVLAGSANLTFSGTVLNVGVNSILSNVNVLGASYDSVSFSVAGQELTPTDLFFSPDGLKMYVLGNTGDDINEYTLTTAWLVSSATAVTFFSVASQDGAPQGMFFKPDGTKMYMVGTNNDAVYQYTLSNPWSIATASYDNISFSVAAEGTPTGLWFKPNGLSMYMVGSTGDAVYQYTLSTAWNVSTATFLQSFSISGQESIANSVVFTGDGSRMFVMGQTGDDVNVYNLTTPWNISTATFVNVFSVSGQDTTPTGLYIKPDGTKMYMVGAATDTVYQYTVPSIDIQLTGQTSVAGLDVQQDLNVYGSTTGFFRNNGFRENIGGQYYNLVSQADIGTAANEIPLNQYLGDLAYMNNEALVIQPQASVTPNGIGDMVFQLTSDTSLVIKVKGSDGTVRSATLTLA